MSTAVPDAYILLEAGDESATIQKYPHDLQRRGDFTLKYLYIFYTKSNFTIIISLFTLT